jgi:hypothetical protein
MRDRRDARLSGPRPGDYALREGPEGRATLDECFGRIDPDNDGEFDSDIEATALSQFENVDGFWFKLFRLKAENRTMSPVTRAIEKLVGSRLRYEAVYLSENEIALSSRWRVLARAVELARYRRPSAGTMARGCPVIPSAAPQ